MKFDDRFFISFTKPRKKKADHRKINISVLMMRRLVPFPTDAYYSIQIDFDLLMDEGFEHLSYFNLGSFHNTEYYTFDAMTGHSTRDLHVGSTTSGFRLYYAGTDVIGTHHFRHLTWPGWSR